MKDDYPNEVKFTLENRPWIKMFHNFDDALKYSKDCLESNEIPKSFILDSELSKCIKLKRFNVSNKNNINKSLLGFMSSDIISSANFVLAIGSFIYPITKDLITKHKSNINFKQLEKEFIFNVNQKFNATVLNKDGKEKYIIFDPKLELYEK